MNKKLAWIVEGQFWTSSAYFQQVYLFADRLHSFGYDSAVANPTSFKEQGDEMMDRTVKWNPNVLVAFGDAHPWAMAEYTGIPMLSWFLWGRTDPPPEDALAAKLVNFGCPSRDVEQRMRAGGVPATYLPHAFDGNVFHLGRRYSARARLGWNEDRPTVLMVGTNLGQSTMESGPDRKNWAGALDAFALFLEEWPSAVLYAHTTSTGTVDIPKYAKKLGIADSVVMADQDRMRTGNRDFDTNHVADLYRGSDVLLMPSLGEGFGIPLIEAQACGIPVVTTDAFPMRELAFTGALVKAVPHPDKPEWALPDVASTARALNEVLLAKYDPGEVGKKVQSFEVDSVVEDHFLPALETCLAMAPEVRPAGMPHREADALLKLDIGAGGPTYQRTDETFTTVDKYAPADVQEDMWNLPFGPETVDEIWSSHALEHIPRSLVIPTLQDWFRVLKPGGTCTIVVPDLCYAVEVWLEEPSEDHLQFVFGSQDHEGEFHKTGWNLEMLQEDLKKVGFIIKEAEVLWTPEYTQDSIRVVATKD